MFGASSHGYVLQPPLPEARVRAWERERGIALPTDCRSFLVELGHGGATPPDDFESDEAEDARNEALDAAYDAPSLLDGAFWICHHGCALRTVLVVTGPERGHVWFDGRADSTGIVPHVDAGSRHLSFGDWYVDSLERALRAASS